MSRGAALITGASAGLGAELANLCAAGGYDVVLVARSAARLAELAASLASTYGVEARPLVADLANPGGAGGDFRPTGRGARGHPDQQRRLRCARRLRGNRLGHASGPAAGECGSAGPPHQAVPARNAAPPQPAGFSTWPPPRHSSPARSWPCITPAKLSCFRSPKPLPMRCEARGVSVTALCPGPTRTEFAQAAGIADSRLFHGPTMGAAEVARVGY